ncbi:MAG: hypothetical protein HY000_16250 [Planctomycetes bacterium]|nr:hypothetical protein [Planctomycetota bacterium]
MWRLAVICLTVCTTLAILGTHAAVSQVAKGKDLDRQHDELLRDFTNRAHKLALQYQQAGSHEKAKDTLKLILQMEPDHEQAKALMDKISKQELTENKKTCKVLANQSWQATGVQVFEGKPVAIEAKGEWVFKMDKSVSPDGMEMPDDMKKFPLGALIGYIDVGGAPAKDGKKNSDRPFLVGSHKVFTPHATGMLYLKMHDSKESDNIGHLSVTISGQVRER